MARKSSTGVLLLVALWLYFLSRIRPFAEVGQLAIHVGELIHRGALQNILDLVCASGAKPVV